MESGFEYFAGGGLKKITGANKDQTSLYELAEAAGYKVTYTQADAEAVTAADGKVILIDEHLADSDAMDYEMDRTDGEWALANYVASYKENGTSFEDAMKDVENLFGLKINGEESDRLVLTDYEVSRLRTAYDLIMSDYSADEYTQEQYVLYGGYNPFSVTVTHILNNKSGVDFTSYSHTGLPVAVFADGVGAEDFGGYYDNTEIYNKLAAILEVK